MPTTAMVYCRISKDADARGLGVARQEKEARREAEKQGWTVADEHVVIDNDLTAYAGKHRPGFERMLEAIRSGEVGAVVAVEPERFWRHIREAEDFIDAIEAAGAKVTTVRGGTYDVSTADGRRNARQAAVYARWESERKSERLKSKHEELAERGRWKGGPRPYGYKPEGDGALSVIPEEAEVIRAAAARVLAGGTLYGICRDLSAQGVPATKGGGWRTPSLARVLTAPMVAGRREFHGEDLGPAAGWEPILDEITWRRVRTALHYGAPKRPGRPPTYLLAGGLSRCGICGTNLFTQRSTKGLRRYACTKSPDRPGACGSMTISADPFERLVVEMVFAAVDTPDLAATLETRHDDDEADDLGRAVAEDEARLLENADMWADGDIERPEYLRSRKRIEARLTTARAKMARQTRSRATDAFTGQPGALAAAWPRMSLDERRAVVSAVVDRVTVKSATRRGPVFDEDRVNVIWKI